MLKILAIGLLPVILGGCAHQLVLVERTSGSRGTATITTAGNKSGDISILLNEKVYVGTWIYVPEGGSYGFSSATAVSGSRVATASGSFAALPLGGGGSILASAPDNSSLRCNFKYSEIGSTGIGECQDSKGGIYDLQIK